MANRKISDLTSLTAPATGDLLPIVDISEAAAVNKNKKITYGELLASAPAGTVAAPSFSFDGDPNTGICNPGLDQLAISTGGVGRVFVNSAGAVSIVQSVGTSFTRSLDVGGLNASISLRALSAGTYSEQGIFFAVDGTNYAQIHNSDIGQLIFRTGSGLSERLRITSAGLVGIGTGTGAPAARLTVAQGGGQLLELNNLSAAADNRSWVFAGGATNIDFACRTDAGGGGGNFFRFNRSAQQLQSFQGYKDGAAWFHVDNSTARVGIGGSPDSGGALLQVFGDRIRIGTAKTPASASATGTAGEICWDANYIYVCTATNTWKRTAIATW